MRKAILFCTSLLLLVISAGCRAQQPVTTWQVNLSWTAPTVPAGSAWTGCTAAAPCTYAVSRASIASGAACPVTTGTSYTLIGSSVSQAVVYTDTTATGGLSYCYIIQTQQTISGQLATSLPSNSAGVAVPASPLAPAAVTITNSVTN